MEIYTLNNGIRVALEEIPYLQSISVGFWVGAGCFAENAGNNGISHFIEHMLFKGTQKRSSMEIASCIDALGGQLNAFTAKECTCFYVNILSEHYGIAIDLLTDMLLNSKFDKDDILREQGVVCEEIAMAEDTNDDLAGEKLALAFFGKHPLGQTILGPAENIRSFTADDIRAYMADIYTCENTVISVAGSFDKNAVLDMLEEKMTLCNHGVIARCGALLKNRTDSIFVNKKTEQLNLCLGLPGVGTTSEDYFAQSMIANIFGGGMSSRLFQRVREQNGMTYAIYSYLASNVNSGMLDIYAGMNEQQAPKVFELITDEADKLKKHGITDKELSEAREQLKGSFVLGLESASSRMSRNGRVLLLNNSVMTPEQVLASINGVTQDDIKRNIDTMFDLTKMASAVVGRCPKSSRMRELLNFNQ